LSAAFTGDIALGILSFFTSHESTFYIMACGAVR